MSLRPWWGATPRAMLPGRGRLLLVAISLLGLLLARAGTPTPGIEMAIRPGSEAGGLNLRSAACPGDVFDFRTCEGVVVGLKDFGLFKVKLPAAFGDGQQSWKRTGNAWSYTWPYAQGATVQVTVEPEGDSLRLVYQLENASTNVLEAVQLHTCLTTTEAPGFFPAPTRRGDGTNWSELYGRLSVWSAGRRITFAETKLATNETHLSLMRRGADPVRWGWWVNGPETFDVPLIALASRDGRSTLALGFEQAVWASSNVGDERACFHLFPWFGRIEPGRSVTVRGRLYLLQGGPDDALRRFCRDFPTSAGPACPLSHGQWVPVPGLTDEFDGERLDEAKWHPRNPTWLGRQPGYFSPKNVRVGEGMLHLDAKKETLPNLPEGYHSFTTAFVKAKTLVRYGYFEIRARAMDSQASSAFWFYDSTPEIWSEIDVFEIGARAEPRNDYLNTHLFHTLVETAHWQKSQIWKAPYDLAKEFHRYGLEWDPEVLRFSVDGVVVREEPNTHWHQPLALCLDSETFPDWFGLPADDALPATFSIDYLRVWKRADGPPVERPWAVEFRFPGRAGGGERARRLKVEEGGALVVRAKGGAERPERVQLVYENEAFFASQTDSEIQRTLSLRTPDGRRLSVAMQWSRTEPWKRAGRGLAGEVPGAATAAVHGYHAVGVEVRDAGKEPADPVEVFEFAADDGGLVQVTVRRDLDVLARGFGDCVGCASF